MVVSGSGRARRDTLVFWGSAPLSQLIILMGAIALV